MVFEDPIENSRRWEFDLEDIRIVTLTTIVTKEINITLLISLIFPTIMPDNDKTDS